MGQTIALCGLSGLPAGRPAGRTTKGDRLSHLLSLRPHRFHRPVIDLPERFPGLFGVRRIIRGSISLKRSAAKRGRARVRPKACCPRQWRCIIYIVRRTQLYLDEDLWTTLHARARSQQTTVSELVREAVRERYLGNRDLRMKAMQAFVGIRKQPAGAPGAVEMVRSLRRGSRLDRLE